MNKKLLCLIGLPLSGKSTFALNLVKTEKNWIRVNRDDLRISLFNTEHDPSIENHITIIQNQLIIQSLKRGYNVVVDNCNLISKYRDELKKICKDIGEIEYSELIINTPLEECLKRNQLRERKVSEDVIRKFAKKGEYVLGVKYKPETIYFPKKEYVLLKQDTSLPKAVICDNDGTISLLNGRNPYDASSCDNDLPHTHVIEMIKLLYSNGYKIIFLSGREEKDRLPTERFYKKHLPEVKYELYMRPTGNQQKDVIIKDKMYNEYIKDKYYVSAWFDDRLQIAKYIYESGLPLFRVNNPEADF